MSLASACISLKKPVVPDNNIQYYRSIHPLQLESGAWLPELQIAYHTYGTLNASRDNVIWVCHALTASSDVSNWWNDLFGEGKVLDPDKYFIVCANNLGSCYGTTSPCTPHPYSNRNWGREFPLITIRDMTKVHQRLLNHLEIKQIAVLIGGSQGGQQCIEWAISEPQKIDNLILLATNAIHSPWGIAFNEAQRMALDSGANGIETARAIAMLSYRNYEMYARTSFPEDNENTDCFGAASYQRHQGLKLAKRFDKDCYYSLSKAMDAHNVGRGRHSIPDALGKILAQTLIIGISSDILFPSIEQEYLANHIPGAILHIIDSPYGHDGFLTESEKINEIVQMFLN